MTLNFNDDSNRIQASAGNDTINSGGGNDTIYSGQGDDVANGQTGNDLIFGENGKDSIFGGDGNDTLFGGHGDDQIDGSDGQDVIVGDGGTAIVNNGQSGRARIVIDGQAGAYNGALLVEVTTASGQTYVQTLTGSYDNSIGIVYELNLAGGDTIRIGITSPEGTFWSNSINAALNQSNHEWARLSFEDSASLGDRDFDDVRVDVTLSGNISLLLPNGAAINPAPGVLVTATGNDSISAGAGNDSVTGGGGNDTLNGGQGDDILFGEEGNDRLTGDAGNDRLFGGMGDDRVLAANGFGNDSALGGEMGESLGDTIDLSGMTDAVTVTFTGNELGQISAANATLSFAEFETLQLGSGADRVVASNTAGTALVNLGAGADTVVHSFTPNAAQPRSYNGGADSDTFVLSFTAAQWASPAVQNEIAAYVAHLAAGKGAIPFTFASTNVTVTNFEVFSVTVNGVTLDPANALVTANSDRINAQEDGAASISVDLLANDLVPDRAANVELLSGSALGQLSLSTSLLTTAQTATLVFTPNNALAQSLAEGEVITETINYRVTDVDGNSATASITITITGSNDAPTLAATLVKAQEDAPSVSIDLASLGGDIDSDDDGSTLTYSIAAGPSVGTASINGSTLTYSPGTGFQYLAAGETALVEISVTAEDKHGASVTTVMTVEVKGTNDQAVILGDLQPQPEMAPNASGGVDVSGGLTFSDLDRSDTHRVSAVDGYGNPVDVELTASATGGNIGTINWRYDSSRNGGAPGSVQTVVITLTDSSGASVSHTITFQLPSTNSLPDVSSPMFYNSQQDPRDIYNFGGVNYADLSYYYTDPDGDTLTASAIAGENYLGVKFDGTGTILLENSNDAFQFLTRGQIYTYTFNFLVSDGFQSQVAKFVWTIEGYRTRWEGSSGDDKLFGAASDDLLDGGAGDDTLTSGSGDDVFAYMIAGDGIDLITDFDRGEDHIGVSASGLGGGLVAGRDANVQVNADANFDISTYNSGSNKGVFIFSTDGTDGVLYWDANGGLADDAVIIARMTGVNNLTSDDFFVFI